MASFFFSFEEIEESKAFKNFKQKNPDVELCAGFFVISVSEEEKEQKQLDYCLKNGKIFTFVINHEVQMIETKQIEGQNQKLEKINREKIKTDLDDVEKILEEKFKENNISKKIQKIIAVLQNHEGGVIWNLNCMLEGMEILQIWINAETGDIRKFEKKNMFDFIKKQ